jgi:hypothetical protein
VGRVPLPAADAHVGPAEDARDRPTDSVFNGVDLAVKGLGRMLAHAQQHTEQQQST